MTIITIIGRQKLEEDRFEKTVDVIMSNKKKQQQQTVACSCLASVKDQRPVSFLSSRLSSCCHGYHTPWAPEERPGQADSAVLPGFLG